jgi:hypothetical protein
MAQVRCLRLGKSDASRRSSEVRNAGRQDYSQDYSAVGNEAFKTLPLQTRDRLLIVGITKSRWERDALDAFRVSNWGLRYEGTGSSVSHARKSKGGCEWRAFLTKRLIKPAMRVQIELALAGRRQDLSALKSLEGEAKLVELTGAEIDAAVRGRSFDVVTGSAVNYALALWDGNQADAKKFSRMLEAFGGVSIEAEINQLVQAIKNTPQW